MPAFTALQSWLMPALLLLFISCGVNAMTLPQKAVQALSEEQTWWSLLHLRDAKPMITDPSFLLSKKAFSPEQELMQTLKLFKQNKKQAMCRFPARYAWLQEKTAKPITADTFAHCKALSKSLALVPFDDLSVVYASQVLSSASSMMGHIFLKAKGVNVNGNKVDHAVSFYTEFDTLNPFSLIYDGLVGGMTGYFLVKPYQKEHQHYTRSEQRNLFEYPLLLTDAQKMRIRLHIWELKDTDIAYLFQNYNCATLTLYTLSVGKPELREQESAFVTPSDVVKTIAAHQAALPPVISLSDEWAITALVEQLDNESVDSLHKDLQNNEYDWETLSESPTYTELAYRFNNHLSLLDNTKTEKLRTHHSKKNNTISINPNKVKDPINSLQDSVLSLSHVNAEDNHRLELSFLPASHYLRSANRQFFSESELKIAEVVAAYAPQENELSLQRLTLYSVTSLVPDNGYLTPYSGHFFLGYDQQRTLNLNEQGYAQLKGGIGKSYLLNKDILGFGLVNIALGINKDLASLATASVKTGLIFNLAFDSKLRLTHELSQSNLVDKPLNKSNLLFSTKLSSHYSAFLGAQYLSSGDKNATNITLGIDYYF